MSGSDRDGGSGRRRAPKPSSLHADDHALWRHVTRTLDPPRRSKARVPIVASPVDGADGRPRAAPLVERHREDALPPRPVPSAPSSQPAPRAGPPPIAPFERQRARRIGSGRIAIDSKLDLHGARLDEAHRQLRHFLTSCAAKGFSTVLVVTGKGTGGTLQSRHEPVPGYERGVLRRHVPLWLEEPDLRALVISFTAAALRHGGEGALYVHLRKRGG